MCTNMQTEAFTNCNRQAEGVNAASGRLDPSALRVLLVDSQPASRQEISTLLQDCSYQVTSKKNSKEALELVAHQGDRERVLPFDIVLKEHEPPRSNACRLLREFAHDDCLKTTPVVVFSSQDERERVVECLQLGACDYLVKPLRQNELRNLWTRVWRQVTPSVAILEALWAPRSSSQESEGTRCDDDEEPASKEGSAPTQEGCGSKEGNGNSGDKAGSGNRPYQSTGVVSANSPMVASKHQDDKNANGGSNGNGASTTLRPEKSGALLGTAEGGQPAPAVGHTSEGERNEGNVTITRPTPVRYAPMEQLVGVKRTASEMAGSDTLGMHSALETMRLEHVPSTDAMQQCPSAHAPSSTSCHVSEDTHHTSEGLLSEHTVPRAAPPEFPPQFPGLPFFMHPGPRPPTPGSVPWPMGVGSTDPPPCVRHPDNTSAPPWAGAAMMQYLLGPFNPVQAQLMLQIQLLADKSGVPPQLLLQQVLADSSQLLVLMSQAQATPPCHPASKVPGQPPSAPNFPPPHRPAGPSGLPLTDPSPGPWRSSGDLPRQQETTQQQQQQQQHAIVMEMLRQQQQQQHAALWLQSLHLWGMMGTASNLGQSPNSAWPTGPGGPSLFGPLMPPMSLPDPSIAVSAAGHVDSYGTLLDRKGKASVTDPRKKRRQVALDKYREKRKNLNSSNTIRYPGRRELAQHRPRSHGQFVSVKRDEEIDPQETRTNGQSRPVEGTEEMVDGGTSCAPREGDLSIQSGDGMNVDEEVEGACVAGNRQPAGQNVQAGGSVARNLDSSALCREPYCMLPIGIPGMDLRLFSPGPMPFSKLAMYGIPEAGTIHHGNNGRNSSDSGSNCPDMQLQDK